MNNPPWSSGPGEILKHGLYLLENDSDVNRRLAMISIDNAVELMIKTYLGLPKRVTGLAITRKEYYQMSSSFPDLLDGLEKYETKALVGVSLGEIEWFHRLRNELYHEGNGLTVEKEKVEIYAGLAKLLFKNLYGFEIDLSEYGIPSLLYKFLDSWAHLVQEIYAIHLQMYVLLGPRVIQPPPADRIDVDLLTSLQLIDLQKAKRLEEIYNLREGISLGKVGFREILSDSLISEVDNDASHIKSMATGIIERLSAVRLHVPEMRKELDTLIAEGPALKSGMNRLRDRLDRIESSVEATCPLCEQSLSKDRKKMIVNELETEGRALADRFRANKLRIEKLQAELNELDIRDFG